MLDPFNSKCWCFPSVFLWLTTICICYHTEFGRDRLDGRSTHMEILCKNWAPHIPPFRSLRVIGTDTDWSSWLPIDHPCLATHMAGHYRWSSNNHRLLIRYLMSCLCQLSAVWNLSEKYSSPSANAERPRTSRSRIFSVQDTMGLSRTIARN